MDVEPWSPTEFITRSHWPPSGLAVSYFAVPPARSAAFTSSRPFASTFFAILTAPFPPDRVAVSPADGKVVSIAAEGPSATRISVFLNIFDVHVNRSPIAGKIVDVDYQRGKFLVASRGSLASVQNEQNVVTVEGEDGVRVVFKQIAGLIARRIVFSKRVATPSPPASASV